MRRGAARQLHALALDRRAELQLEETYAIDLLSIVPARVGLRSNYLFKLAEPWRAVCAAANSAVQRPTLLRSRRTLALAIWTSG